MQRSVLNDLMLLHLSTLRASVHAVAQRNHNSFMNVATKRSSLPLLPRASRHNVHPRGEYCAAARGFRVRCVLQCDRPALARSFPVQVARRARCTVVLVFVCLCAGRRVHRTFALHLLSVLGAPRTLPRTHLRTHTARAPLCTYPCADANHTPPHTPPYARSHKCPSRPSAHAPLVPSHV